MEVYTVLIVFLICGVPFITGTNFKERDKKTLISEDNNNIMDVSDFSVYYDLKTNETFKKMMPRPWYKPGWKLRLPFTGGPCACDGLKCSCCTGVRIPAFNYDRKTCTILTYEPESSMLNMDVQMNNATVYRNSFSARNPPPFCMPLPVPYLPPGLVDMCIRLFDISIVNQMLHVCMDIDTRIDKAPVLVLHFDCMNMGLGGVTLTKPGNSSTTNSPAEGATTEPSQLDGDIYDPVDLDKETIGQPLYNNSVKYI